MFQFTFLFFLNETDLKILEQGGGGMQRCSQSYSQVDYWDKKTSVNI